MLERRSGLRVKSDQIKIEVSGQEIEFEDISIGGVKLTKFTETLPELGTCTVKINYVQMDLDFKFEMRGYDHFMIFTNVDAEQENRLLQSLKNIHSASQ